MKQLNKDILIQSLCTLYFGRVISDDEIAEFGRRIDKFWED